MIIIATTIKIILVHDLLLVHDVRLHSLLGLLDRRLETSEKREITTWQCHVMACTPLEHNNNNNNNSNSNNIMACYSLEG